MNIGVPLVTPPNWLIATVPSWQLKQALEAPSGCPTAACMVGLE
jgi:hypothetical protein